MGMSEPEGPGRKGACLLIPAMPLLAPQLLTSSLPALSNLGTQSADSWWLRVAWEFADPYVRAICEKMKGLEEYPGYGFAVQIDVTVGNALLIVGGTRQEAVHRCACPAPASLPVRWAARRASKLFAGGSRGSRSTSGRRSRRRRRRTEGSPTGRRISLRPAQCCCSKTRQFVP